MAYRPSRPPEGRTGGTTRYLALGAIAVLPALLVSAFVVYRSQGAGTALPPPAARQLVSDAGSSEAADDAVALATPEETAPSAPRPTSLGIAAPEVTAATAIVVDEDSMAILYEKGAHVPRAPASVTKIATAIVAVEHGQLDVEVTSDVHHWTLGLADSSTMGIEPGDVMTLRDLLYGLMLVSGNDAAIAIGRHISGSDEAFVAEMNALAARLGLQDTHFANAAGLSDPDHYSSAWDIAVLARYLMRFPDLREIVGTETYTVTGERNGEPVEFDLYNHNPLLNYTAGVDGVKTGYTEEAGRTFVVSATRDGHRVYVVLLGTTLRAQDSQALIEWAFENHRWPGQDTAAVVP